MNCTLLITVAAATSTFQDCGAILGHLGGVLVMSILAICAAGVFMDRDRTTTELGNKTKAVNERVIANRPNRTVIVGAGQLGQSLRDGLERTGKFEVLGFIDDELLRDADPSVRVLGATKSLSRVIDEHKVDEVIIAFTPNWHEALVENLSACHPTVAVSIVPAYFESLMRLDTVKSFGDIAVVKMVTRAAPIDDILKRAFDIVLASLILVITLPVSLVAGLMIRLTSHGRAIFSQERIGRDGNVFTVFKFRTMVKDAEAATGPVLADGAKDARLTPVGKWLRLFRIDELPQLWNVLRGEMSIVGPRPERPEFVAEYAKANPMYSLRHRTRPGITGLAQVMGGYHTHWRDKLRFDLMYVSNQSVLLDISILFRTVSVVLFKRGHEKD